MKAFRFLRDRSTALYLGEIGTAGFRIRRNIRYRNSFLPLIRGAVEETGSGSRIGISMRMHLVFLVFTCAWMSGVGFAEYLAIKTDLARHRLGPEIFIPAGMILVGYLLVMGSFKFESRIAKRYLASRLDAVKS